MKNQRSACRRHGPEKIRIQDLVDKPERERELGRSIHRWMNHIKMSLKDMSWNVEH